MRALFAWIAHDAEVSWRPWQESNLRHTVRKASLHVRVMVNSPTSGVESAFHRDDRPSSYVSSGQLRPVCYPNATHNYMSTSRREPHWCESRVSTWRPRRGPQYLRPHQNRPICSLRQWNSNASRRRRTRWLALHASVTFDSPLPQSSQWLPTG